MCPRRPAHNGSPTDGSIPRDFGRSVTHFVLPTLLFAALGGMTWAVRGCSGFGAVAGCVFAGVMWGAAWWFIAQAPGGARTRRYGSGWIVLALTVGIGLSGARGWMQWPSFFEGKLMTNAAEGRVRAHPQGLRLPLAVHRRGAVGRDRGVPAGLVRLASARRAPGTGSSASPAASGAPCWSRISSTPFPSISCRSTSRSNRDTRTRGQPEPAQADQRLRGGADPPGLLPRPPALRGRPQGVEERRADPDRRARQRRGLGVVPELEMGDRHLAGSGASISGAAGNRRAGSASASPTGSPTSS